MASSVSGARRARERERDVLHPQQVWAKHAGTPLSRWLARTLTGAQLDTAIVRCEQRRYARGSYDSPRPVIGLGGDD